MTHDGSGRDEHHAAYFLDKAEVRREFRGASCKIWIDLIHLLAQRWPDVALARRITSETVTVLSDLANLRCLPDGHPLAARVVLDRLYAEVTRDGETPGKMVEQIVVRSLAGKPRSGRSTAEITALIETFLQCYATDYERGELTWVDELYSMAVAGDAATSWTVEVPDGAWSKEGTIVLRIPVAALEAAYLRKGDRLILEPRPNGLWLGRGSRA
ncbi:hypothetical protein [Roseicella aerolata]|uniref:Uncharacterized protein n=1 Tax=Roseicella aerolata TaxID=2883479 RepID=A0A9X1IJQ6_9PROT|nr:hypothetical protein [Roseicella aerolata]MCB4825419.1 hypothetical protein [Roseicella aerolata]